MLPDWQSLFEAHTDSTLQGGPTHVVGAEQTPSVQTFPDAQSVVLRHVFPVAQPPQDPPQSTSVSLPFFARSEHVVALTTQTLLLQTSLPVQSAVVVQLRPVAQGGEGGGMRELRLTELASIVQSPAARIVAVDPCTAQIGGVVDVKVTFERLGSPVGFEVVTVLTGKGGSP